MMTLPPKESFCFFWGSLLLYVLPSFFFFSFLLQRFWRRWADGDTYTVIHTKTKQGSSVTVFSNLLIFVLDEVFLFLLCLMRSSSSSQVFFFFTWGRHVVCDFFFPINRRLDKGTSARERETSKETKITKPNLSISISHIGDIDRYRRLIDRSIQVQIKSCAPHTCSTTHIHTIIQLTHHTAHKSQGAGKSLDSILYYYYYFGLPFCIYTLIG